MKPVIFNNTVLRDGHQSLAATRMTTDQMVAAAPELDRMGFGALETWGGATIDSCLRYLSENPFDRLRTLKKLAPKTPHMMLLRGQNIVQYASFPDDVVEAFVACAAKAGVDIFRIFDALNDLRNVTTAVRAVKAAGKHAQGAISYTTSPVHTLEAFVQLAKEFERLGCDSICIKDMAGLIQPSAAAELVRRIKASVKVPLALHSHNTAGLAGTSYFEAVEAGVDIIDVSIAPFANGTGQPDAFLMYSMLEKTPRCPKYDADRHVTLVEHFRNVYEQLAEFTSRNNERTDVDILRFQVPGGMLSNFRNQLKEQGMSDKWDQVLNEIPYVREKLGWIPLVTPTSQIVGTQAMLNVKFGRWKNIAQPTADVLLGKYGRTPGPIDPELRALAEERTKQKAIDCRAADILQPRMSKLREELKAKGLPATDENAVLYAMFPQQLEAFYKPKAATPPPAKAAPPQQAPTPASTGAGVATESPARRRYLINIDGRSHEAFVETV
ncbi:MAG TPA: pyruvate carboxylase subunit B [Verrucomicrobiae bacterium]|nr:pyruvate carboxylase subunit B [Verrucomicrobiae bacterium]